MPKRRRGHGEGTIYQTDAGKWRVQIRASFPSAKSLPTFSDALGAVRYQLWHHPISHTSLSEINMRKAPNFLLKRFTDAHCYAN